MDILKALMLLVVLAGMFLGVYGLFIQVRAPQNRERMEPLMWNVYHMYKKCSRCGQDYRVRVSTGTDDIGHWCESCNKGWEEDD